MMSSSCIKLKHELPQKQASLNGGKLIQVISLKSGPAVDPSFCSNPHLLRLNTFFSFNLQLQSQSLEDYIPTSIMLQYNSNCFLQLERIIGVLMRIRE